MSDDLLNAVTMLFRQRGKRTMTEKEFLFGASIDFHWFPYPEAQRLLDLARSKGLLVEDMGHVKPSFDVSQVDVPVGFKPGPDVLKQAPVETEEGLFPRLLKVAEGNGMKRRDFISQCNRIQDHMDVDIEVASLLVLRENGVDVMDTLDEARSLIAGR